MKKIYLGNDKESVDFSLVSVCDPIFAYKDNVLCGMIVNEECKGWITRTGGPFGINGHHNSLKACIQEGQKSGYSYWIA